MTFSRLYVVERIGTIGHNVYWRCQCTCGKEVHTTAASLFAGTTKSCRCLNEEETLIRSTKHQHNRRGRMTPEYRAWSHLKSRCLNPNDKAYKFYGKRGITVCARWCDAFEVFLADMGMRPSREHSIDRIDVNGSYEPSNCRWSTRVEQANNRRNNIVLSYNDETLPLLDWATKIGVKYPTLLGRFHAGWSSNDILTKPVRLSARSGR